MAKKHVRRLIDILGGPTSAGRALKKSRLTMYLWIEKGCVPAKEVLKAELVVAKFAKEKGISDPPTRQQLNSEYYP